MLEIRNVEVMDLPRAVKAISNSYSVGDIDTLRDPSNKEWDIAKKLGKNCDKLQCHDSYLKGILVSFDMKYPLYISPELQRYHWFEITMSQSTMHSISKMLDNEDPYNKYVSEEVKALVKKYYEDYRSAIDNAEDKDVIYEKYMILRSNLPSGFEMWETITTNYLQLKRMCIQRMNHKLKEDWGSFTKTCMQQLPLFRELTGISDN